MLSLIAIPPVATAANCTADPVTDHYYSLINYGSGKALDISGANTGNTANVIQWNDQASPNQQFYLTDLGNGYWSIMASHSGRSLDVAAWSTQDGEEYDYIRGLFERALPRKASLYKEYHALIVNLGKNICRKEPLCGECPLSGRCSFRNRN